MNVSVVLSTYRKPRALELVLRGYAVQSDDAFELVVADDGSGPETAAVVDRAARETGLDLVHVRQEDHGFRKSTILNRAILEASGDYLIFSDGDCIPRADLVSTHRSLARRGRYVAGGYLKLPREVSEVIREEDVVAGRATDLGWLRRQGWRPGRRALRLTGSPFWGRLFDFLTPTAAHFHGNNASVSREALRAVNGFDAEMGYGGLDKALGLRLENAGWRGLQARHRAVTVHLHHERPYRDDEVLERNRRILRSIRRDGWHRARSGIDELEPDPGLRVVRHSGRVPE